MLVQAQANVLPCEGNYSFMPRSHTVVSTCAELMKDWNSKTDPGVLHSHHPSLSCAVYPSQPQAPLSTILNLSFFNVAQLSRRTHVADTGGFSNTSQHTLWARVFGALINLTYTRLVG